MMIRKKIKSTALALTSATLLSGSLIFSAPASASAPFIAQIVMFSGNFAPRGWAFCDGQLLPIAQNTALFSVLGTTYGGDGETTFGLPDLRGRVAIHAGNGPGLANHPLGQKSGVENVTLTIAQMPNHTHDATADLKGIDAIGDVETPGGHALASKPRAKNYSSDAPAVAMHTNSISVTVQSTGNGQSFSIRDPYLAVNYIIALQGLFPS